MSDARDLKPGDWIRPMSTLSVSAKNLGTAMRKARQAVQAWQRAAGIKGGMRRPRNARQVRAANAAIWIDGRCFGEWRWIEVVHCTAKRLRRHVHEEYARLAAGEK